MADWSLIRQLGVPPAGTYTATNIAEMYCIVPGVVPFDLSTYIYKVGIEPEIPEFYLSIQNFLYDRALSITVKAPPFVRVYSKGTDIELTRFFVVPPNNSFSVDSLQLPPLFLGPPVDDSVTPPAIQTPPPIFGRTGTDFHGLLAMKVVFDDEKALQDPEFTLGPQSDGTYTLEFDITPWNVEGPVYILDNVPANGVGMSCPPDINEYDDADDIGDDGTPEEPPAEEDDDRVTIVIEGGAGAGDILWIDGTTGILYNADNRSADNYRELPDDWTSFGGMMFPPDQIVTPCIMKILKRINKVDIPPLGYKRRGFHLDPWTFMANRQTEETQDLDTRAIVAQTWECVVADLGELFSEFEIPKRGLPKTLRYGVSADAYEEYLRTTVNALMKFIRLRQFARDGNDVPGPVAASLNAEYEALRNQYLPGIARWGTFGLGENILDWGDHFQYADTEQLLNFMRSQINQELDRTVSNDKLVFARALKHLIELTELGKEIPTKGDFNKAAAPASLTAASIIYDIQEKGEGKVPPIPGPYETETTEQSNEDG